MKYYLIDASGLDCPKPVILTKKAAQTEPRIRVIVDNETAQKNIIKLAKSINFNARIEKTDGEKIFLLLEDALEQDMAPSSTNSKTTGATYLFASESFGDDSHLGDVLMKSFLFTISESDDAPDTLIFLNSGVKLTTQKIPALEELEKRGTLILSCGACLNYFNLEDKLEHGIVSNMYEIHEKIINAQKYIKIS